MRIVVAARVDRRTKTIVEASVFLLAGVSIDFLFVYFDSSVDLVVTDDGFGSNFLSK